MCLAVDVFGYRPSCVAVVSTGGGGDPGSAAYLAEVLAREGVRSILVVLPWERYVRDPWPGPIPLDAFNNIIVGSHAARLLEGCYAIREGTYITPSACSMLQATRGLPVYIVDGWLGELGVRLGLLEAASLHGCEAAVALDVGGDVLASGGEKGLWSPLADSLGLAAVALSGLDSAAAIHSPGADGELEAREVLDKIAAIAREGGYLAARGVARRDLELLETILDNTHTEAGKIPLLAAQGETGTITIRRGTRSLEITPLQAITFFLDAHKTFHNTLAKHVAHTPSLHEANNRLNNLGIYTELDLETDIRRIINREKRPPTPTELLEIREEGRRRLRRKSASGE